MDAMPDKIQVTIIGLGLWGASAGMALRRHGERVAVIGHDRNPDLAASARKLGAVEKTEWNLPTAASGADRIILSVPLDEVKDTLAAIGDTLKPGCTILAMCDVIAPVLGWGREILSQKAHLVCGHPIVIADQDNAAQASADLFKDRLYALTPEVSTDETAVQLATDLVNAMDARPFYADAYEHDVLTAATEQAASILGAALVGATARGDNWRDLRRLAAGQYYSTSLMMPPSGQAAAATCLANRDALLPWLDAITAELEALRREVADSDEEALASRFDGAMAARSGWLIAYSNGQWDQNLPLPEMPTMGSMMKTMLGFGRTKRTPPAEPGKR
jgi:prephenate dehydrogenase